MSVRMAPADQDGRIHLVGDGEGNRHVRPDGERAERGLEEREEHHARGRASLDGPRAPSGREDHNPHRRDREAEEAGGTRRPTAAATQGSSGLTRGSAPSGDARIPRFTRCAIRWATKRA